MITGYILHLTINTFLDVVVKNDFPVLSIGWYLFIVVTGNRNLPRGSNKMHFILLVPVMYLLPDG